MKWVRYLKQEKISWGLLEADIIKEVAGSPYQNDYQETGQIFKLQEVKLLAPCEPSKILCIGLNYHDHIEEMKHEMPSQMGLFLKPPTAVIGPLAEIIYPALTKNLHYEGELAVIIKKAGRNIKKEQAEEYIFGFTCANDVTARDLQKSDIQWTRGKSFDTFCPLGPYLETDFDFTKAGLKTILNGQIMQNSNLNQLIFKVPEIVEYISAVMTLLPGDVILTGTPAGVGPMQRGDKICVEIEGLGRLENTVK